MICFFPVSMVIIQLIQFVIQKGEFPMSANGNKKKAAVRRTRGSKSSPAPVIIAVSLSAAVLVAAGAAGTYFLLHKSDSGTKEPEIITVQSGTTSESGTLPVSETVTESESPVLQPVDSESETGSAETGTENPYLEDVQKYISRMTLEEKVCQLFIASPEAMVRAYAPDTQTVTLVGDTTKVAFAQNPIGGILFSTANINTDQTSQYPDETAGNLVWIQKMAADFQAENLAYNYRGQPAAETEQEFSTETASSETATSQTAESLSGTAVSESAGADSQIPVSENTAENQTEAAGTESTDRNMPLLTCVTENSLREFLLGFADNSAITVRDTTLSGQGINMVISSYNGGQPSLTIQDTNRVVDVLNAQDGFMYRFDQEHTSDGSMASTQLSYRNSLNDSACVVLENQIYSASDPAGVKAGIRGRYADGGAEYDGVVICPIDSNEVVNVMKAAVLSETDVSVDSTAVGETSGPESAAAGGSTENTVVVSESTEETAAASENTGDAAAASETETDTVSENTGSEMLTDADYVSMAVCNAFLEGADMILCTSDYDVLKNALLDAVKSGKLSEDIIDEALVHVLTMKLKYFGSDPQKITEPASESESETTQELSITVETDSPAADATAEMQSQAASSSTEGQTSSETQSSSGSQQISESLQSAETQPPSGGQPSTGNQEAATQNIQPGGQPQTQTEPNETLPSETTRDTQNGQELHLNNPGSTNE